MTWGATVRRFLRTKALTIIRDGFYPRDAAYYGLTGTRMLTDYGREVQEGYDSNVVMAPVMWIMRTFTEAWARVESRTKGLWQFVEDHPIEVLIDQPNPYYNGDALWKATAISYTLNGNAYWLKVRNAIGDVIELWYLPHWLVQPISPPDHSRFISHYEYRPGVVPGAFRLSLRDVVHLRFGLDPRDPRYGLSPLQSLLREVFVDDEAQVFSAKILQNMGVPGLIVSPKDGSARPSKQDIEQTKSYLEGAFTGRNRGRAFVMTGPTDVAQFGFDPNKLTLGNLRDISEERVCAALALPASVVGFGSGLQSTTVGATMSVMRRLAWVQCLIPMQKSLADQLTAQLLPDFVSQARRFRVRFDTSDVSAFQEEDDLRAQRIARLVQAGILRVDRAQAMMGFEVDPTQKVYLRPANSIAVDEQGAPVLPATPSPPNPPAPDPAVTPAVEPSPENKILHEIAAKWAGNGRYPKDDL